MSYRNRDSKPYARMTAMADGRIAWKTNYSKTAIEAFKAQVPYFWREWDGQNKQWLVEPQAMPDLMNLAQIYHSTSLAPLTLHNRILPPLQSRTIKIAYIGAPKEAGGMRYSSGKEIGADWYRFIFLDDCLQNWFEPGKKQTGMGSTWYDVLGIGSKATPDEIKKAHRICAKTWHPDMNDDPEAPNMFRKIQEAYEGLRDPQTRAKYDAFMLLEKSIPYQQQQPQKGQWRPPVRCGQLTVNSRLVNGYNWIESITSWQPITNQHGQTMVSQWDRLMNDIVIKWI